MAIKLAKDLQRGDKVIRDSDGKALRVTDVARGMITGYVSIRFSDGDWSEQHPRTEIEVA